MNRLFIDKESLEFLDVLETGIYCSSKVFANDDAEVCL